MGRLEVELALSLYPGAKHAAHWNIHGDKGDITINLPEMWRESKEVVDRTLGLAMLVYPKTCEEKYIEEFIADLSWSYLMERICLERGHEKWRIKGKRCGTPYRSSCCVLYPVQLMIYPHLWKQIQRQFKRRPYQAAIAGADRLPCQWLPKG